MTQPQNDADPLRAVGGALANWSLVELELASLFSILAGIPNQKKAYAAFDVIVSFEVRVAICDRLMAFEEVEEVEAEMWNRLSAKLSASYKKRHQLAHFVVFHYDSGAVAISPFYTWTKFAEGTDKKLSTKEIRERSAKFIQLHKAINWFTSQKIRRLASNQPDPLPDLPEPSLVPRLRASAIQILEAKKQTPSVDLD